jgi:molecular chaperone HscA
MTLIQISDPRNNQEEIVVGIDFGTTNCLVAFSINHNPFVIKDNHELIASILSYKNGIWSVGETQLDAINIFSIKRILGKTYQEIMVSNSIDKHLKQLIVDDSGKAKISVDGKLFDPIYLASLIFVKLKQIAQQHFVGKDFFSQGFSNQIKKSVVTVPAYFHDKQKAAIKKAATLAGFEVIRLLSEPIAAGFAYGINNNSQGQYLVYDFGGGTFDVSLLKICDKVVQVVAVAGDDTLGGDDIDQAIAKHLNLASSSQAKKLKENLALPLTIEVYEDLSMPIIEKTLCLTSEVLSHGNNTCGIILVGGSSRMPFIKKALAQFNLPILDTFDPDKAVVLGAALQAENLSRSKSHVLVDVAALSLGIEILGGLNEKIIMRNSPIPTHVKRNFTTYVDNQFAMKLHILQGEREFAKDCKSLGVLELKAIPQMPAGIPKIEVSFCIDADGLLYVSASESSSEISTELVIQTHADQQEIQNMMHDAINKLEQDHEQKILKEAILKAENFISQVEKILSKLNIEDKKINEAKENLYACLKQNDTLQIQTAQQKLDELFTPICARHFNEQIAGMLKGSKISS